MIHQDKLDQRAAEHHESERDGTLGIGVLDLLAAAEEKLHQVAIAAKLQIDHFPVEGRIGACLNELADAAQQAGGSAVADQHAVNQLLSKERQRDLARQGRREDNADAFILALHDLQDYRLEQSIFVAEAAIDRARREPRVVGDARKGGAFDAVLAQDLRRGLRQLAKRLAAALLLRGERSFLACHAFLYIRHLALDDRDT